MDNTDKIKQRFVNLCYKIDAYWKKYDLSDYQEKSINQAFDIMIKLYSESWRHHHTMENHIIPSLLLYDEIKHLFSFPDVIEMAIFMHDVIYNPLSKFNEEASAMFANCLLPNNSNNSMIYSIITSCKRSRETLKDYEKLFNDIDYAIIGADRDEYQKYSENIRKEYSSLYTEKEYRVGRVVWIMKMLAEKQIFMTEYFQERFESQARENLTLESKNLTKT